MSGITQYSELLKVLASFEQPGLDYVIVGGIAVNLHGATPKMSTFSSRSIDRADASALRQRFDHDNSWDA